MPSPAAPCGSAGWSPAAVSPRRRGRAADHGRDRRQRRRANRQLLRPRISRPGPLWPASDPSAADIPSIRCLAVTSSNPLRSVPEKRARWLKCPIGLWSPFHEGRGRGRRRGPWGCARMGEQSERTQRRRAGSGQDPRPVLDALFRGARDGGRRDPAPERTHPGGCGVPAEAEAVPAEAEAEAEAVPAEAVPAEAEAAPAEAEAAPPTLDSLFQMARDGLTGSTPNESREPDRPDPGAEPLIVERRPDAQPA